ncbi:MAG: PRC-barrel domain-containing protein [Candidatus Dormiibacterota bacterium]
MSEAVGGETTQFTIGSEVECSDGVCGVLRRVVVDPEGREVTHLAIEPKLWRGMGRLVSMDLVEVAGEQVRLRCTLSEFETLEEADEIRLTGGIGGTGGAWGFGTGLAGSTGMSAMGGGMGGMNLGPQAVASDRVPMGEVEVHRGDHVHATDGDIGRVQGVLVNSSDHRVTHVLLAEGHLWGQKRVLIPIDAVTSVDDGVVLNLTKDEVRDLPSDDPA